MARYRGLNTSGVFTSSANNRELHTALRGTDSSFAAAWRDTPGLQTMDIRIQTSFVVTVDGKSIGEVIVDVRGSDAMSRAFDRGAALGEEGEDGEDTEALWRAILAEGRAVIRQSFKGKRVSTSFREAYAADSYGYV